MIKPAATEMSDWVEELGMSEYAQRFAENDIDIEVRGGLIDIEAFGDLTDADFDRLGVSMGHHGKLLKAIAVGVPTPPESPRSKSATEAPSAQVTSRRDEVRDYDKQ